ncbi:MAG: BlaI/MecI/CopY family transcriptional regulator [Oscillospiraceae bacterium]|nr:BlaI/MecI/CopY family transcriptional regulator [Oscillospiraceae bacterium]
MEMTGLSDAEWKLMNLLWESSPRTVMGLVAAFRDTTGWTKHTLITMLSRLEAKGAVRHEEGGRAKQFYPDICREEARLEATEHFLDRLYGGSLGLMLNTMAGTKSLSAEDLDALRAILKKAEEEEK